jgi:hypothetical protein
MSPERVREQVAVSVVDGFREFEEDYRQYTAFHEELRAHPETFAISRRDLSILRAYFHKLAQVRKRMIARSRYGFFALVPLIAEEVLKSEDEYQKLVLCRWFKIGLAELRRQIAVYLPEESLEEEIDGYQITKFTFDDHSEACVNMSL